jgi:hypothetical protein
MREPSGLLTAGGAPVEETPQESQWQGFIPPKGSSPYFGWIDLAGEPATIRVELIAAVAKDARTQRFVVIMANAGASPTISDRDAYLLLRRLGWTMEKAL